jgi:hypothetical protein
MSRLWDTAIRRLFLFIERRPEMGQEELLLCRPPAFIRLYEHGPHAGDHLQGHQREDQKPQLDAGLTLE